jgi:squalene synthase HpnC
MSGHLLAPERTASSVPAHLPEVDAVMRQAGAENFPVALRVLPRAVRAHLMAVYGFARLTDDIGDEADGDRLAMLDWLEAEVALAAAGAATHPILQRLTPTMQDCALPLDPFQRLIEANRRDQSVARYETFDDLLEYCWYSAAPVGELVLRIFGVSTPERIARSDEVCAGLQVVEHLQDAAEDMARDRVYLPQRDLAAFGCTEADLVEPHAGAALRAALSYEADRARRLLASAGPLARQLPVQPRVAICAFAAGGHAALDAVTQAEFDVLGVRCRPRPAALGARLVSALAASRRGNR